MALACCCAANLPSADNRFPRSTHSQGQSTRTVLLSKDWFWIQTFDDHCTHFHTLYFLIHTLYLLISHIFTDVAYIARIYPYFRFTARIYVISGPTARLDSGLPGMPRRIRGGHMCVYTYIYPLRRMLGEVV